MGREIRMVPPNWEHPRYTAEDVSNYPRAREGQYRACHNEDYESACKKWYAEAAAWKPRDPEDYCQWYHEYAGDPPDEVSYRPKFEAEPTWLQVYETVSEGTPVTPPFATPEELIDYLVAHGDFWDQRRCKEPDWATLWGGTPGVSGWKRENAERFVKAGWAPSMVVKSSPGGASFSGPRDGMPA